ncbi:uncharacterized protein A4U43_C04F34650 [Asparagus officinalis]|uniref:Uncharacterized protein n=1 Tax=Asparagus officinalis TaxID=4686 RepID=A0A5P1FAD1_ASPOF|nr:uncharacterized protein A4U43_C04F34650 [Asparagus officinalis]
MSSLAVSSSLRARVRSPPPLLSPSHRFLSSLESDHRPLSISIASKTLTPSLLLRRLPPPSASRLRECKRTALPAYFYENKNLTANVLRVLIQTTRNGIRSPPSSPPLQMCLSSSFNYLRLYSTLRISSPATRPLSSPSPGS